MGENTHEMQDQLKAAYALNMCTVSVSQIVDYNDEYILEQEYEAKFSIMDYEKIQKSFSFQTITKEFFDALKEDLMEGIGKIESLDELDDVELDIVQFCRNQGIDEINPNPNGKIGSSENDGENNYIPQDVWGRDAKDESFSKVTFEKMLTAVKDAQDTLIDDGSKVELLVRGDSKFDLYFKNVKLQGDAFKAKTLAVLDDHSFLNSDLFITCDGVVPVKHNKVDSLRDYNRIEYQGKSINLGWPEEYSNRAVNLGNLYSLLEKLANIRENARANA